MRILLLISFFIVCFRGSGQNIQLLDRLTSEPVPYVTIGFGNGLGTFANGNGIFRFSKKLYPDVDSLQISSLGYRNLNIAVVDLEEKILLDQETNQLNTIIIREPLVGDFKVVEIDASQHKTYENSWLPTVESEVAVKFDRVGGAPTQISKLQIPILLEKNGGRKNANLRKFSTMFRMKFYEIEENGKPAFESIYPSKTFVIDQTSDPIYSLDISDLNITIPKSGLYVAIQALGYTKPDGELINSKKYREIKTARGVQRISNTYRPLLPFVESGNGKPVMVRRVFFNDRQWQPLNLEYNQLSKLVRSGRVNYGMGAELRVFKTN
jgi:hypothetical protein